MECGRKEGGRKGFQWIGVRRKKGVGTQRISKSNASLVGKVVLGAGDVGGYRGGGRGGKERI